MAEFSKKKMKFISTLKTNKHRKVNREVIQNLMENIAFHVKA